MRKLCEVQLHCLLIYLKSYLLEVSRRRGACPACPDRQTRQVEVIGTRIQLLSLFCVSLNGAKRLIGQKTSAKQESYSRAAIQSMSYEFTKKRVFHSVRDSQHVSNFITFDAYSYYRFNETKNKRVLLATRFLYCDNFNLEYSQDIRYHSTYYQRVSTNYPT